MRLSRLRRFDFDMLPTPPRRLPPPETMTFASAWPPNADATIRLDPIWQAILRDQGHDAVKALIDEHREREAEQ